MTVNELIEKLQKLKEEHGDVECFSAGIDSEYLENINYARYDKDLPGIVIGDWRLESVK